MIVVMFNPAGNPPDKDGTTTKTLMDLACNAKYQGQHYGGLLIANIFIYKAPRKPRAIKLLREKGLLESSGGLNNSRHLDLMARQSSREVLLAWGDLEPDMKPYADAVKKQLSDLGRKFLCLGITDDKNPRHPGDWNAAKQFEPFSGTESKTRSGFD